MATSNFDATKIHMGPAEVIFNDKHLGYTLNDSVKISMSNETTPVTPDQASLAIMDVVTGTTVTVEATFAQVEDILELLPGASTDGLKDPGGIDLKQMAASLVIKPYDANPNDSITDYGFTYTFPKACPIVTDGIQFAKTTPQGIAISFKVYADEDGTFMTWAKATA